VAEQLEALADVSGTDTTTYRGYISALESRRAAFKDLGATATDHGHLWPEALELSEREASRLYDRLRTGPTTPLMSPISVPHDHGDGPHVSRGRPRDAAAPRVWRSHDTAALTRYGADIGGDFPVATGYTASLQRLLDRFGSHPGFRMVAFTVDETVFSRELAPMASYYPGLWLGAPWWFLDSPDAMTRFWGAITESAGFAKSAGFVDDTRAYCSVPARHDLARRAHCAFLAVWWPSTGSRRRCRRAGHRFCLPAAQVGLPAGLGTRIVLPNGPSGGEAPGLLWRVADGLDVVAVRVSHEGAVVIGVVLGP